VAGSALLRHPGWLGPPGTRGERGDKREGVEMGRRDFALNL